MCSVQRALVPGYNESIRRLIADEKPMVSRTGIYLAGLFLLGDFEPLVTAAPPAGFEATGALPAESFAAGAGFAGAVAAGGGALGPGLRSASRPLFPGLSAARAPCSRPRRSWLASLSSPSRLMGVAFIRTP